MSPPYPEQFRIFTAFLLSWKVCFTLSFLNISKHLLLFFSFQMLELYHLQRSTILHIFTLWSDKLSPSPHLDHISCSLPIMFLLTKNKLDILRLSTLSSLCLYHVYLEKFSCLQYIFTILMPADAHIYSYTIIVCI